MLYKTVSPAPTRKVSGMTISGAILIWVIHFSGISGIKGDLTLETALIVVVNFIVGYFIPPSGSDGVEKANSNPST